MAASKVAHEIKTTIRIEPGALGSADGMAAGYAVSENAARATDEATAPPSNQISQINGFATDAVPDGGRCALIRKQVPEVSATGGAARLRTLLSIRRQDPLLYLPLQGRPEAGVAGAGIKFSACLKQSGAAGSAAENARGISRHCLVDGLAIEHRSVCVVIEVSFIPSEGGFIRLEFL